MEQNFFVVTLSIRICIYSTEYAVVDKTVFVVAEVYPDLITLAKYITEDLGYPQGTQIGISLLFLHKFESEIEFDACRGGMNKINLDKY